MQFSAPFLCALNKRLAGDGTLKTVPLKTAGYKTNPGYVGYHYLVLGFQKLHFSTRLGWQCLRASVFVLARGLSQSVRHTKLTCLAARPPPSPALGCFPARQGPRAVLLCTCYTNTSTAGREGGKGKTDEEMAAFGLGVVQGRIPVSLQPERPEMLSWSGPKPVLPNLNSLLKV